MRETFLPFSLPSIGEEESREVLDCLDSGWLTTGPKVKAFEQALKDYVGCSELVVVNSCTAALHLSLLGAGIQPGDEVVTTPLTFCSTVNVIIHCNAKPALIDIDAKTYNIDPNRLEDALRAGKIPKAVIPVHYAGQTCDMKSIWDLADRYGFTVIEDAAHALGATYEDGEKVGHSSRSVSVCFSFYPIKNITTGEGGAVATSDSKVAEKVRMLSLHGINKDAWKRYAASGSWYYEVQFPGFKYNMMDIQAAIGIHQMRKLDDFVRVRSKYAKIYDAQLGEMEELVIPFAKPKGLHGRHLYPVRLNLEMLNSDRGTFVKKMKENNIGTTVNFIPIHHHPYYQKEWGFKAGDYPITEEVYKGLVSIPLYPKMSLDDVEDVISAIKSVIAEMRR
jgi:dTDP-4-amino-4,6-dideoxygalactose transaminase